MSMKAALEALVQLQVRELEIRRLEGRLEELPGERQTLHERVETAEGRLQEAEEKLEAARKERRRLEGELQDAEKKVSGYKDQIHDVKTNEELWALQKEIAAGESEVGEIEEEIILNLEEDDELQDVIHERQETLEETRQTVQAALAEIDRRESEMEAERERLEGIAGELRGAVPDELLETYGRIKNVRSGVAVAAARDETCLACNVRLRPQLYVEARNADEVVTCDNCGRILFVADALELPDGLEITLLGFAA